MSKAFYGWCCCFLGFSAKGLLESDPGERQHPFGEGGVVMIFGGGEGLPQVFCLVASSLGHLCSQCLTACGSSSKKGTQWVYGGVEEIGVSFQQMSVTGSKAGKEDRIRTIANEFAIFKLPYTSTVHELAACSSRAGV